MEFIDRSDAVGLCPDAASPTMCHMITRRLNASSVPSSGWTVIPRTFDTLGRCSVNQFDGLDIVDIEFVGSNSHKVAICLVELPDLSVIPSTEVDLTGPELGDATPERTGESSQWVIERAIKKYRGPVVLDTPMIEETILTKE